MSSNPRSQSIFFCFCGPSGSGKTTLTHQLLRSLDHVKLSISTTTRAPRGKEVDGKDYYFVTTAEFTRRIEAGTFLEHAKYGGNHYGTERSNLTAAETAACDLLLDIDLQGVTALKKLYPKQTVTVFVFPPSWAILEQRIRERGTESSEQINKRLQIAAEEVRTLRESSFSDYLLVNENLESCVSLGRSIIEAERNRLSRFPQSTLSKLVDPK